MPDIVGRLRPPRLATPPATPVVGELYYDTVANVLYCWNGTAWTTASGALGIPTPVVNGQWIKGVGGAAAWAAIARTDLPIAPFCRIYSSVQQNFTANAWTTCSWDSESFDNDTMHDPASNSSRITCKTGGIYAFMAGVYWAGAGGTHRVLRIVRNGATAGAEILGMGQSGMFSGSGSLVGTQDMRTEAVAFWGMNVNDYAEVQVFADVTTFSYAGGYSWFGAAYLGRYS
jgi:hypothetical protein